MQFFKTYKDIPSQPERLTQVERALKASRNAAFKQALQERLDKTEFCFAYDALSQDIAGWYVSNKPHLSGETGVTLNLTYRPMAADSLFWEMVGLSTKKKDTLAFRNRGLWTLHSPYFVEHHGEGITDVDTLADIVVDRTEDWSKSHKHRFSLSDMLKRLGPHKLFSEDERILAICLSALQKDYETAHLLATLELANDAKDKALASDYSFVSADGLKSTLIDKAIAWLITKRRESLKLVN